MKSFNKQLRYTHTLSIEDSNSVLYNNTNKLNPYFVTGFTDGFGCFIINIRPNPKLKTGYSVELVFKINLHSKGIRTLLENIRNYYFGVGTVTVRSEGSLYGDYPLVTKFNDRKCIIIPFFMKYQLKGAKSKYFVVLKEVVQLMENNNASLTKESF